MENENKFDATKNDKESFLEKAAKAATKKLHDKGLYSVHADDTGVYLLYPDGQKKYAKQSAF